MRVERERMCNSDRLCSRGYVLQCWFGLWRCSLLCSVLLLFSFSSEQRGGLSADVDPGSALHGRRRLLCKRVRGRRFILYR